MANLYTHFDNGKWNGYVSGVYSTFTNPVPGIFNPGLGRTTFDAYEGVASFGVLFGDGFDFGFRFFTAWHSSGAPTVLTPGKKYRMSARVKTPAGAGKIGTDGVVLWFGEQSYSGPGVLLSTLADGNLYTMPNGDIIKVATVAQLVANPWVKLYIEWIEPASGAPGYRKILGTAINSGIGSLTAFPCAELPGELINDDGRYSVDNIELEEVTACDLTLGAPSYTKTDESIFGADNGSVTINATSSFTKSYAIDNIAGPYQSSNIFTGLAPGVYDFYIKDTNPDGCSQVINDVTILAAGEPPPPPPDPPAPGPLSIDSQPLNENNFVRWYGVSGYKNFNSITFSNCCWDTPAAYRQQTEGRMSEVRYAPILVPGEMFSFYINFIQSLTDPDFLSYRLALMDHRGIVQDNISPLSRDIFDDGVNYNIYSEVTAAGFTVDHYYRFMIYNSLTNVVLFVSNEIQVLSEQTAKCESVRLKYRASINLYGFRYEALPLFLNVHRMRMYRVDEQDEGTLEQYRAVTSGQLRNVCYEIDRYIELESYYFDDGAHRAAGIWQLHDTNIVNDKAYLVKTNYKREKAQNKSYYKGSIQLYDVAFSSENRFSRIGNVIDPDGVGFLMGDGGSRLRY